jgi:hypothetical protein
LPIRCGRRFVDHGPERAELPHRIDERVEVNGLHDVGVRTELVAADQVLLFARRRQHDDRYRLEHVIRFQRAQHVQSVHFGHLEIQEKHCGISWRPVRKRVASVQVIKGLGPIPEDHDLIGEVDFGQRRKRQLDVVRIVFRENDALQIIHHGRMVIILATILTRH